MTRLFVEQPLASPGSVKDWSGLSVEVKEICREIGVPNLNEKDVSKEELEEAIYFHNYKEMKLEVSSYKKLEAIKNDDFRELPEFMNDKSINRIKMNYKGSFKNNLSCKKCESGENETQCHAMVYSILFYI
jgi:hypothetical protein